MNYRELAYEVLKLYLTDYTEEELKDCINKAYDEKFDTRDIAPLKKGDYHYLELFHGQPLLLRIWHCLFCPIYSTTAAKRIIFQMRL